VQRWDHQHLGVVGIGTNLDEPAWRDVFRQLVALGFVTVDHAAYGALRLADASRPVLKGEQSVEMRRTAPRVRRTRKSRATTTPPTATATPPAAAAGEAGRYAQLKAWRLAEAQRQALPAYVILHDATLAEIARRVPRDLAALAEVPGIGARKLERYGPALLALLGDA
jgi:ATP-dependent DNA helicase RecQ